jgi:hypothetical protein
MKKLFAAVAVVALAAIGVPVAAATSASAATPSTGALDRAWTTLCNRFVDSVTVLIDHTTEFDKYVCGSTNTELFPITTPQLQQLCAAMDGTYTSRQTGADIWVQDCVIVHV